jgi:quercetin dioxygenase-like cupin family protein/DNA-binding Xre family transcriptional regulator
MTTGDTDQVSKAKIGPSTPGDAPFRVGPRLRHARLVHGLRLGDLAKLAGCSESMVSKIENDRATPSLTSLHRLCKALDISVSDLLSSDQSNPWGIMHPHERPVIGHADAAASEGMRAEVLVPFTRGRLLEGFIVIIEPGGGSGPLQHQGEEVGYVIEGQLELTIDGKLHRLEPGDSFYFPSSLLHSYRNAGTATMRAIWINTPPSL